MSTLNSQTTCYRATLRWLSEPGGSNFNQKWTETNSPTLTLSKLSLFICAAAKKDSLEESPRASVVCTSPCTALEGVSLENILIIKLRIKFGPFAAMLLFPFEVQMSITRRHTPGVNLLRITMDPG